MNKFLLASFLLVIAGCGGGSGKEDDTQTNSNAYETSTTAESADCVWITAPGEESPVESGLATEENITKALQASRAGKGDFFIYTCSGDVDYNVTTINDNHSVDTNTTDGSFNK